MYLRSLWIVFRISLQRSYFVQEVPFEDIIALTVLTEPTETYWQVPSTLAPPKKFWTFSGFFCLQHVTTANYHCVRPDEDNSKLYTYVYMQVLFVLFPGHFRLFIYKYTLSPGRTWGSPYFRQISIYSGAADIFNTIFRRFLIWGRGGVWNNCWWGTPLFTWRPERWDSIGNLEVTDSTGRCISPYHFQKWPFTHSQKWHFRRLTCISKTILYTAYGSVCAGRKKWPFNVLFFKSRASVWPNLMR